MLEVTNKWGRKIKKMLMKDSIQSLNRKGKKFDWDNDKLFDLEVKKNQSKMIHPDILAELTGIELRLNLVTPSPVTVRKEQSPTKQAAAARIAAGPDVPPADSAATRGVDDAPAADGSDNVDQGVESNVDEDRDK